MDSGIRLVGLGGWAERGVSAVAVGLRTSRARSPRRGAETEYVRARKGRWESMMESALGCLKAARPGVLLALPAAGTYTNPVRALSCAVPALLER